MPWQRCSAAGWPFNAVNVARRIGYKVGAMADDSRRESGDEKHALSAGAARRACAQGETGMSGRRRAGWRGPQHTQGEVHRGTQRARAHGGRCRGAYTHHGYVLRRTLGARNRVAGWGPPRARGRAFCSENGCGA